LIEGVEGLCGGRKVGLDEGFAARGEGQELAQIGGKNVRKVGLEILQRGVNGASDLASAEGADSLVNGDDTAHLGGIDFFAAEDFELGIDHFAAGRTLLVDFDFAVKDELHAGLQTTLEETAVEEFARKRAAVVLHEEMVDGVAAVHPTDGLAAHDASTQGINTVGLNVFYFGETDAVFVAKREIVQKIFQSVDTALGKQLRAVRADSFDHLDVGLKTDGHRSHPLYHLEVRHAFRELA